MIENDFATLTIKTTGPHMGRMMLAFYALAMAGTSNDRADVSWSDELNAYDVAAVINAVSNGAARMWDDFDVTERDRVLESIDRLTTAIPDSRRKHE